MQALRSPLKGFSCSDSNINRAGIDPTIAPTTNITTRNNTKRVRLEQDVDDDCEDNLSQFKSDIMDLITKMLTPISTRLDSVEKSLLDIKKQNVNIQSSNNEIEKSLDFLSHQIKEVEKKMDGLERERLNTQMQITELEEKNESLERIIRKTSVEIKGVPKRKKEDKQDLLSMVNTLMKTVELEVSPSDVKDIFRLPSKETAITSALVLEFSNTFIKDKFLKSTRKYNSFHKPSQLNSSHLGISNTDTPLFFSDHLTTKAKRLHFLARDFAQKENFRFCWITNGRIFLRKKEGDRHILVKNENTLQQLRATSEKEKRED